MASVDCTERNLLGIHKDLNRLKPMNMMGKWTRHVKIMERVQKFQTVNSIRIRLRRRVRIAMRDNREASA